MFISRNGLSHRFILRYNYMGLSFLLLTFSENLAGRFQHLLRLLPVEGIVRFDYAHLFIRLQLVARLN